VFTPAETTREPTKRAKNRLSTREYLGPEPGGVFQPRGVESSPRGSCWTPPYAWGGTTGYFSAFWENAGELFPKIDQGSLKVGPHSPKLGKRRLKETFLYPEGMSKPQISPKMSEKAPNVKVQGKPSGTPPFCCVEPGSTWKEIELSQSHPVQDCVRGKIWLWTFGKPGKGTKAKEIHRGLSFWNARFRKGNYRVENLQNHWTKGIFKLNRLLPWWSNPNPVVVGKLEPQLGSFNKR